MAKIFISYRRDDAEGFAGWIRTRLSAHFGSDTVFQDITSIPPGTNTSEYISNAVKSCHVLLALIDKQWLRITDPITGQRRLDQPNDFVRLEIAAALDSKLTVIPVLLRNTPMPREFELPDALKPLSNLSAHLIDSYSFDSDVDRLIKWLEQLLGHVSGKTRPIDEVQAQISAPFRSTAQPAAVEHPEQVTASKKGASSPNPSVKVLVVCGGAGRGLLGQREALGFDAEVQIDVSNDLVIKESTTNSRAILINQEFMTSGLVLDGIHKQWESSENAHSNFHAHIVYSSYPASRSLVDGLGQTPVIGGAVINHAFTQQRIEVIIRALLDDIIHPQSSVDVWIVSSTAGGTGAGTRRKVGELFAQILATQTNEVHIHFLTFGALSYASVSVNRTRLNTFFCVAADSAFSQNLKRRFPKINATFYYLEVADAGSGDASKPIREALVDVASKAVMLDQLKDNLKALTHNNPNNTIFVRVGWWGSDINKEQILYETLKSADLQLSNLENPDYQALINDRPFSFQRSRLLEDSIIGLNSTMILNALGRHWQFPRRPRSQTDHAIANYLEEVQHAIEKLLPTGITIASLAAERANTFVYTNSQNESVELGIGNPQSQTDRLVDSSRRLNDYHLALAWCAGINLGNTASGELGLGRVLLDESDRASSILNAFGIGAQQKASRAERPLQTILDTLVQIAIIRECEIRARDELARMVSRVENVHRKIVILLNVLKAKLPPSLQDQDLVITANLDDEIDRLNHYSWFEMLEREVLFGTDESLCDTVRAGAVGLTKRGLASTLRLPEHNMDISELRRRVLDSDGEQGQQSKVQLAQWWQNCDISAEAGSLFEYRIFPAIDEETRAAITMMESHHDVRFIESSHGEIGLRVLAVGIAVVGGPQDIIAAPRVLLTPFIKDLRGELKDDWPITGEDRSQLTGSGMINVACSSVIGDPLYGPVLENLQVMTDDEMAKFKRLFNLYDPNTEP